MRQFPSGIIVIAAGLILLTSPNALGQATGNGTKDSIPQNIPDAAKPKEAVAPQIVPQPKPSDGKWRIGSFVIDPRLEVSESYSDNIFATRNDKEDDFITEISPSLRIESAWSKHSLEIYGGADIGRYADNPSEDYNDYNVGMDGRIDLTKSANLFGGLEYIWDHEERDSPESVAGTAPTEYENLFAYVGGQEQFGRISLRLGGTFEQLDYHDVPSSTGIINNDDRDRELYGAGGRVGYLIDSGVEVFLQGESDFRAYDQSRDDFGRDRDSSGFGTSLGMKMDFGGGNRLEILGGYLDQDYDDGDLKDVSTFDAGLRLRLRPTTRTTVTALLDRTVEETTNSDASSYLATTFGGSVRHWLSPDANLNAGLYYTIDDYVGLDRHDGVIEANLGYNYYIDPRIWIGADYTFTQRNSDMPGEDYDDNQIFFRIGLQQWPGYSDADMAAYLSGPGSNGGMDGFYAGIQMQFGTLYTGLDGPRGGGGTLTADFADHGGSGGLFGGYGWQFSNWYVGAEVEGELSENDWEHARTPGGREFSVEKEASIGANARLGYIMPGGGLLFGQFGVVGTEFETRYQTGATATERDSMEPGIRIGAGVEVPVGESMFVRLSHSYTAYRDYDIDLPSGPENFSNAESLTSLGFGYRFGGNFSGRADADAATNDFTGFYLGAQAGYGGLTTENEGPREAGSTLVADRGSHGATGGLMGGYGHRWGDFYLAGELEADISDANWSIDRDPQGRTYSVDKDYTIGGSAIAGYVLDDVALLYARGGVVVTEFDTSYDVGNESIDDQTTELGVRFGVGIEVPASESFSIRADYSYTIYDEYSIGYEDGRDSFENSESLFRLGVIHRF